MRSGSGRLRLESLEDRTLPSFALPVNYNINSGPDVAAVADLTNDGKLSIVTSNYYSSSASVLLGNGDGTFRAPVNYSTHGNAQGVAVGDFTGSGRIDLAVSNYSTSDVTILLNNGDGTFHSGGNYACGALPQFIAVADLNHDGNLDLITANSGTNTISVLLGNGDGTFQAHKDYFANGNPNYVAVGDFFEDGNLDLAVTNGFPNTLSILRGNGDGSFQAPSSSSMPGPIAVAAADLSGSGHLDLVVANLTANHLSVLRGNGNGTFQSPVTYATGAFPHSVVIGDFTGSGTLDLASGNQTDGSVSVLLGNSDGTFQNALRFPAGAGVNSVVAGDFTGSGRVDLATANFFDSSVSVLLNDGNWPSSTTLDLSAPQQASAGAAFEVTVTARRSGGAIDANYQGTVHFTTSDPRGTVPADYTFTPADQGAHTFLVTLGSLGSQQVTVVDIAHPTVHGSATIFVTPGEVSTFHVTGFPSPARAGSIHTFDVTALDAYGNTVTDYQGTVHFQSTDPRAILYDDYTFTAADAGSHTFAAVLETAGAQSLTVSDVSGQASGTQDGIVVMPASAAYLAVLAPPSVNAGGEFGLMVTAYDAFGNVATDYTSTVHFTSSDPQAVLPGDYTFAAADQGSHTFAGTLKTAGPQSLVAADTVTSGVSGQVSTVVKPAAATHFSISGPASVGSGSSFSLLVTALDAYGNVASGYSGTVHFKDSVGGATLPGNYTFTAADGGVHTFTGLKLRTRGTQTITVMDTLTASILGTLTITVT